MSPDPVLNLTGISLRRGRKLLFENATFQVHERQRMGLVGANGSGKSSLFALLLGELESDDGELGINPRALIAHVAQESPSGQISALDYVQNGDEELRRLQGQLRKAEEAANSGRLHLLYERLEEIDGFSAEARASRLLNGLGFSTADINRPVSEFSGGWRMRLNLAQALMCRSDILLLDEPTNHLDLPAILWLERWLKSYPGILMVMPCAPGSHTSSTSRYPCTPERTVISNTTAPSNWRNNSPCTSASRRKSGTSRVTSTASATRLQKPGRHRAA